MNIEEVFKVALAVIGSLGGGALIVAAFANWLGGIWAKKMLQNERALHSEKLENLKKELDIIKEKDLTRHHDKLLIYRDVVHMVCEILRELEAVAAGRQEMITDETERNFALNRNKSYGYISLTSTQEVMDKYNELIDFLIPVIYENRQESWVNMRQRADNLLNAMRKDLGINEGEIIYRGQR